MTRRSGGDATMTKLANTDHPIHDLLRRRWSPRAYAERRVEPEKLRRVLEAARWAASSYNGQPWAFIVATRDEPAEFARLLSCLIEFNQSWAKSAPVLMLTVARQKFEHNGQRNSHAWHDVGLAVGNLTLQATAEGLFLHQMAGILPDQARTAYGIPADWDAVTGIALGYVGDPQTLPESVRVRETAPSTRKPLSSFVFAGDWGKTAGLLK
jgi:nitroreductase